MKPRPCIGGHGETVIAPRGRGQTEAGRASDCQASRAQSTPQLFASGALSSNASLAHAATQSLRKTSPIQRPAPVD